MTTDNITIGVSVRQLSIILAALRLAQRDNPNLVAASPDHFEEIEISEPVTAQEIDLLCEQINIV